MASSDISKLLYISFIILILLSIPGSSKVGSSSIIPSGQVTLLLFILTFTGFNGDFYYIFNEFSSGQISFCIVELKVQKKLSTVRVSSY